MNINIKEQQLWTMIDLEGPFDASASKEAQRVFSSLLSKGSKNYVIDLSNVDFIDSSGLGTLVGFFKKVRNSDGSLKLTGVSDSLKRIFKLTHLDKVFTFTEKSEFNAA